MSQASRLEKETVPQAGAGTAEDMSVQVAPDIRVVGETYRTVGDYTSARPVVRARNVDVFYGDNHAIQNVSLDVGENEVISLIGPSGCGKSTFIRCLNRMNDTIESARVHGEILLDGEDIYSRRMDVVMLRARVGIVFQKPNPFRNPSTTTLLTGQESMDWPATAKNWTRSSVPASKRRGCGRRSRTDWRSPVRGCQADSSSGCALPGPSP